MEEITLDDLQVIREEAPADPPALIQVAQLPIIIEHLAAKAAEIAEKTGWAMSLAVSPETLADVRKVRADLNKEKAELEAQRKQVKQAVLSPYEEFEAVYNKCVKVPFDTADRDLASKIHEVEQGIIGNCTRELQAYFAELVTAEDIEWLTWDRLNIRISLTDAKQKSHQKLRNMIRDFVQMKANAVKAISTMEDAAEIMAEYKLCLSTEQAIRTVSDRHKRIEEENHRRQEWEAKQAEAQQVVQQTQAAFPDPVPAPAPAPVAPPLAAPAPASDPDDDTVYTLKFSVRGTKPLLRKFKEHLLDYCKKEGLEL